MNDHAVVRRSGLLIPLFSCATTRSWGVGDIGGIGALSDWMAAAGQRVLQLLPINEMAPGQHSPYSAISAMAIDPIVIDLHEVADFNALGGEACLSSEQRELLASVRISPSIAYHDVRSLKQAALRLSFARFSDVEWPHDTDAAKKMKRFLAEQAWWIEDYAIFRAIHASQGERPWTEWPEPLRRRDPVAIGQARRALSADVLFYQYLQWVAYGQWREARKRAAVALFGDLPFMVDGDSADVWARQDQFRLDASVGAPPDAFSATGQDWGMPLYRWDVIADEDFRWLRERARRSSDLYDGYRVDHLVGFYRTYARRLGGDAFFSPAAEADQVALGERILSILRESGAEIVAEDLGIVPDFVRASLRRLGVPGFCVFRWERHWHVEGQPFRDPAEYPPVSVAASGTHDTETLAVWWSEASADERRLVIELPTVGRLSGGIEFATAPYNPVVRDILLEAIVSSASSLVLLPVQDVFGWRHRINEPGIIGEDNWTFRLPWPVDRLNDIPEARERQDRLRRWAEKYSRLSGESERRLRVTV